MLRDSDIRAALHEWLWDAHARDTNTVILHELKIPRPSARVDIAVVNGEICGFEIKSDVDGLARLPRQVKAFSTVFDRVCVVTTRKHVASARKIIPEWWGIISPIGDEQFERVLPSLCNPNRNIVAALHMLSRSELCGILDAHNILRGLKSKPRNRLIDAIVGMLPSEQVLFATRHALKSRSASYSSSSSM